MILNESFIDTSFITNKYVPLLYVLLLHLIVWTEVYLDGVASGKVAVPGKFGQGKVAFTFHSALVPILT